MEQDMRSMIDAITVSRSETWKALDHCHFFFFVTLSLSFPPPFFFFLRQKRLVGSMTRNQSGMLTYPICRQASRLVIGPASKALRRFFILFATWFGASAGVVGTRDGKGSIIGGLLTPGPKWLAAYK
jgi:hypothetical protein